MCTLVSATYDYPVLVNSSDEAELEDEVDLEQSDGRIQLTQLRFYPVGTVQTYNVTEDACGNDSLTLSGNSTWSICEAPDDLELLLDSDEPGEMRRLFWFFNYGLWSQPPPECGRVF